MITFPPSAAVGIPEPDYESAWIEIANNADHTFTHNLGVQKPLTQVFIADSATPTNLILCYATQDWVAGRFIRYWTTNTIQVRNDVGATKWFKVRCWKLGTATALSGYWDLITNKLVPQKPLNMNTQKIEGVVDPTADQEAATKKYVDDNVGGGGAWNLIVDEAINTTLHTVSNLDGNTDKIYHIILDGAENANNSMALLSPNNDITVGHYQNAGHEVGYYNGTNFHGYSNSNTLAGLKVIHNFTPDTASIFANLILTAKSGAWRKVAVNALTTNTQNPPGVHKYDATGVWQNSADNITSLVFRFGNTFTGRLYIFDIG